MAKFPVDGPKARVIKTFELLACKAETENCQTNL